MDKLWHPMKSRDAASKKPRDSDMLIHKGLRIKVIQELKYDKCHLAQKDKRDKRTAVN